MRTLKKTLCLVLCLAMMVGMCAIAANATEFTDDADIENKEEVDLLVGLGIIEGYTDGSFNPTKVLTRAEACKIIAYLLLGKDAADALEKTDTIFTDVTAAHWASGYIGYCAKMGIVEGIGNNKFDPSGTLTAAAWGKMLLCALGYDQDIEGMTGESWDFNVTRLVSKTKLATGYAFSADTEMTRDSACLLAYNALTVPTVEYVGNVKVTTSDGTTVDVNAQKEYGRTLAQENFNMNVGNANDQNYQYKGFALLDENGDVVGGAYTPGVITANDANTAPATGETELNEAEDFEVATGEELLGHYVKIYTDKDGNVISVTDVGTIIESTKGTDSKTFKSVFGATPAKFAAKVTGDEYYFIDGEVSGFADLDEEDYPIDYAAGDTLPGVYVFDEQGVLVSVILSDGEIYLAMVTKVDEKNEKITITGGAPDLTYDEDNVIVEFYEGIAKYDVVLVTVIGGNYKLTEAEAVNGAITKVTPVGAKKTVTIDGVDYAQSACEDASGLGKAYPDDATIKAGATYTLYLDKAGKYIACVADEEEEEIDALLVIGRYDKTVIGDRADSHNFYAVVVDAAGEMSDLLYKIDGVNDQAAPEIGTFVTAGKFTAATAGSAANAKTYNGAGIKYFAALNDGVAEDDQEIWGVATDFAIADNTVELQATAKAIPSADGNVYVNDKTVYVFYSGAQANPKVEVKTGGVNFDVAAQGKVLYTKDRSGNQIATAVYFNAAFADAGISAKDLLYFTGKAPVVQANGYTYTAYNAATGEKVEVLCKSGDTNYKGFYKYTTSGDYTTVGDYQNENDVEFYDIGFKGVYNNGFQIAGYDDIDVSKVVIVDLRAPTNDDYTDDLTIADFAANARDYDFQFDLYNQKVGASRTATVIFVESITAKEE